jgi:hypothetical protein
MSRFRKIMAVIGFASVGTMYQVCAYTDHGFSVLPNLGFSFNIRSYLPF